MSYFSQIKNFFTTRRDVEGARLVGLPEAYWQKQKFQFDFLKGKGLSPDHYFIDIGCGVLRGGVPIIKFLNKDRYLGLDINAEAIEIAKKKLIKYDITGKRSILNYVDRPLSELSLPFKADRIWAFSVLIHMTDEHVRDCLKFVSQNLKMDGLFYANVNLGDIEDGVWREFPVKWKDYSWYEIEARKAGLKTIDLGNLKSFGHESISDVREDNQHMLEFSL